MIKASSTLISIYTDNYDDTDIDIPSWCNCKWDMAKTICFQLLTRCCFYHFC